ncbi:MAG: leucine-rich repeat protein [Eubacterium sp.]|nr:leucine-rich repeat protein [Eubacterium sp.]
MKMCKRKKSTAWLLVLIMVLSLTAGVGVLPKEVAKADNSDGDAEWIDHPDAICDFFVSEEGGSGIDYATANAKRVNEVFRPGTYYIHMYSNPQANDSFESCRLYTSKRQGESLVAYDTDKVTIGTTKYTAVDDNVSGTTWKRDWTDNNGIPNGTPVDSAGRAVEDPLHNRERIDTEPGTGHHYYYILTVSEELEEPVALMNAYGTDDGYDFAWIKLRSRDALWVTTNVNDLSSEVGTALYQQPGDEGMEGFFYLGRAYYYVSDIMYPNATYEEVQAQNRGDFSITINKGESWSIRGVYDENGNPKGSHVFFQYYLVDSKGTMRTFDNRGSLTSRPVSYLVYDEYPENTSQGSSIDSAFNRTLSDADDGYVNSCTWTDLKGDGTEVLCPNESHTNKSRTFGTSAHRMDFYNIWGLHGSVTVNGDIIGCMALDREKAASMYYNDEDEGDAVAYGNTPGTTRWYCSSVLDSHGDRVLLRDKYPALFAQMYANWDEWEDGESEQRLYANLTPEQRQSIINDQAFDDEMSSILLPYDETSITASQVVINGDVGFIDLHDTWRGTCTIGDGYSFGGLAWYENSKQLFKMDNSCPVKLYSTVLGDGQPIIQGGQISRPEIHELEFEDGGGMESRVFGIRENEDNSSDNMEQYMTIFGRKQDGEYVESTCGRGDTFGTDHTTDTDALIVDVAGVGEPDVAPMLRKKKGDTGWRSGWTWFNAIKDVINVTSATIMDIALICDNDHFVEPASEVNLYIEGLDDTRYTGGMALYHVTEDGRIEKLAQNGTGGRISAPTGRFSTYFVAEDKAVPSGADPTLAELAQAQYAAEDPVELGGGPSGGDYSGGSSSGSSPSTPAKETTVKEKDADGNDVTKVTKTNQDGSKEIKETTTDPETGEVLKTTETTIKTDKTTGTVTTESKTTEKDGTVTERKFVEEKDGSTSEISKTTYPDGKTFESEKVKQTSGASKERTETKEKDGSSEVVVTNTKANGDYVSDTITTTVTPSTDGSAPKTKTTIEREEKNGKKKTNAKYTVSNTNKKTVTLTSFTSNAKGGTVSIGNTVKADGTTYKVTAIAAKTFKGNKKVKVFKTGNSVTKLGDQLLMKAKNLRQVVLGKNVKELGSNLFNGASSLKNIRINSKKINKVGDKAFAGISDNAVIRINASKKVFKSLKKKIRASGGLPKDVTFKRV